jgi:UDPglucose 6-dehydrogenase
MALRKIAEEAGYNFRLVHSTIEVNRHQREVAVKKIEEAAGALKGKTVALLGLSFKPNTDDIRESPALDIALRLLDKGAKLRAFDPAAMKTAAEVLKGKGEVFYAKDSYEAAQGADLLVVATEWNQFRNLNLQRLKEALKEPVVVDLRNVYEPEKMKGLGFRYWGMGRR